MPPWVVPAALAFLLWGVYACLPKLTTRYVDAASAVVYHALGGLVVALVVLVVLGFRPAADPRGAGLALVTGMLGVAGALAYLYAVTRGPVGVIATVTAPDLETLPQARHVIDKHLAIFAHREGFETLDWQAPVQA